MNIIRRKNLIWFCFLKNAKLAPWSSVNTQNSYSCISSDNHLIKNILLNEELADSNAIKPFPKDYFISNQQKRLIKWRNYYGDLNHDKIDQIQTSNSSAFYNNLREERNFINIS